MSDHATDCGRSVGTLEIDLAAVVANWRKLDNVSAGSVATGVVIKADAYSLGAARIARTLLDVGARDLFVANVDEGVRLRAALGFGPRIFVFAGYRPCELRDVLDSGLVPLLNSPQQVSFHLQHCRADFGVQLDCGMNRLGLEADEWASLRATVNDDHLVLVMSHLACAEEPEHPLNMRHLTTFKEMTAGVDARRSLAATAGIVLGARFHFDMTRPGIGLHLGRTAGGVRPAVRVDLPIIQTRNVQPGEAVGYAARWTANEPAVIATLAAGYGDGIFRHSGAGLNLFAHEIPCPVVGRISMDLITVDVSHLQTIPETLNLIGPQQGVEVLAAHSGTIPHEMLARLGSRYQRHYLS